MNRDDNDRSAMLRDFEEFMKAEEVRPPRIISESIYGRVRADLKPNAHRLFMKVGAIHTVVGAVVISVCPQFGIGFYESTRLLDFFMQFGHYTCMIACGALFLGATALVSNVVLSSAELMVFRERKLIFLSLLSVLSMVVFLAMGGDVAVSFGVTWILGAMAGSITLFEISLKARHSLRLALRL